MNRWGSWQQESRCNQKQNNDKETKRIIIYWGAKYGCTTADVTEALLQRFR
jgi:hypothetical protein